eukprot:COSAG02_NODE_5832_length_4004_cov_2.835339_6_plen_74_part_00
MLCYAVQILKADSVARRAELQAQLQAVKKENQSLRNTMSAAARVHMSEVRALLPWIQRSCVFVTRLMELHIAG